MTFRNLFDGNVEAYFATNSPEITVKSDANQNNSGEIVGNDICGRMILSADCGGGCELYLSPVYIGLMLR